MKGLFNMILHPNIIWTDVAYNVVLYILFTAK